MDKLQNLIYKINNKQSISQNELNNSINNFKNSEYMKKQQDNFEEKMKNLKIEEIFNEDNLNNGNLPKNNLQRDNLKRYNLEKEIKNNLEKILNDDKDFHQNFRNENINL